MQILKRRKVMFLHLGGILRKNAGMTFRTTDDVYAV